MTGRPPLYKGVNCYAPSCQEQATVKGLCPIHYTRMKRNGSFDPIVKQSRKGKPLEFLQSLSDCGDECVVWPFARNPSGYGSVQFNGRQMIASRACCIIHNGPPKNETMQAAHSCGNGSNGCVNPKHLRWATPLENTREKHAHGTSPVGSRHPSAIITEADVVEIRRLWGEVKPSELSLKYGIRPSQVRAVATKRAWRHVE